MTVMTVMSVMSEGAIDLVLVWWLGHLFVKVIIFKGAMSVSTVMSVVTVIVGCIC